MCQPIDIVSALSREFCILIYKLEDFQDFEQRETRDS